MKTNYDLLKRENFSDCTNNFYFPLLITVFFFLGILTSNAQIAVWNPAGLTNYGPSPFAATTEAPYLSTGGLTREAGLGIGSSVSTNLWGGINWSNTDAATGIAANQFVTFSLSPDPGATLSISSIDLFYRRSSTGPTQGILEYSVDGAPFSLATTLSFAGGTSSVGTYIPPVNLSGIGELQNLTTGTVTFRIVPFAATSPIGSWWIYNSGIRVNGTVDVALPLRSLNAFVLWNEYPVLTWTAQNFSNNNFVIERSDDQKTFVKIGEIFRGEGTTILKYQFTDSSELHQTVYYYRLVQRDENGGLTYSPILMASRMPPIGAWIDNSISEEMVVHLSGKEKSLMVYVVSGQIVCSNEITEKKETIRISIPSGLYLIHLIGEFETEVKKVIVR